MEGLEEDDKKIFFLKNGFCWCMLIKAPCDKAHTSTTFKTAYCMPAAAVIREVHAGAVDAKVIFHISGEGKE